MVSDGKDDHESCMKKDRLNMMLRNGCDIYNSIEFLRILYN